jgi:hypothetical protein
LYMCHTCVNIVKQTLISWFVRLQGYWQHAPSGEHCHQGQVNPTSLCKS